jgi:hypothetical protein
VDELTDLAVRLGIRRHRGWPGGYGRCTKNGHKGAIMGRERTKNMSRPVGQEKENKDGCDEERYKTEREPEGTSRTSNTLCKQRYVHAWS